MQPNPDVPGRMRYGAFDPLEVAEVRLDPHGLESGDATSMPQTVARNSYSGEALQAWQSLRVGSRRSVKVVNPFASITCHGRSVETYWSPRLAAFVARSR